MPEDMDRELATLVYLRHRFIVFIHDLHHDISRAIDYAQEIAHPQRLRRSESTKRDDARLRELTGLLNSIASRVAIESILLREDDASVDLVPLTIAIINSFQQRKRGILFHLRHCFVPKLDMSSLDLHCILHTLIENAVQSIENEHPQRREISVSISQDLVPTIGIIKIKVTDTGCSINPRDIPEQFMRNNPKRSPNRSDGLYFARKIADQYGGTIEIIFKQTKGTVTTLALPLRRLAVENGPPLK